MEDSKKVEDFLEHYGILGMKWGRRTSKSKTKGLKNNSKKNTDSDDHKQAKELRKKKLQSMTNKDLETLNRRLQLETQYKTLTSARISPGKKFAKDILTQFAKTQASTYLNKFAIAGVGKAIGISSEVVQKTLKPKNQIGFRQQ